MKGDKFIDEPGSSYKRLITEYEKHGSLVIGFDFDGTVRDFHKEGYEFPKMRQLLRDLKGIGCKLVCWTAYKDHQEVMELLNEWEIPFDSINGNGIDLGYESRKPFFSALLDDRAGLKDVYSDLKRLLDHVKAKNEPFVKTITAPSEEISYGFPYTIFLAGSIDMGKYDWQFGIEDKLKERLLDEPDLVGVKVVLYNPRRKDWDTTWGQEASNENFAEQVNWELDKLEESDLVLFNFEPDSKSPITLLELGYSANMKKTVIRCPKEFYRRGNVEIFSKRLYSPCKINETIDESIDEIIFHLKSLYREIL